MLKELLALLMFYAGLALSLLCLGRLQKPKMGYAITLVVCGLYIWHLFSISVMGGLLVLTFATPMLTSAVRGICEKEDKDE